MDHNFNVNIAKQFGVDEAIIIHNIYFWTKKNKANGKNFFDGHYWTYNSISAFVELFPYFSKRQLERILKNAEAKGAILKGNYNNSSYDRTSWYAVTPLVLSIYANGEMDLRETQNGFTQNVEPIPYSNTYNKQTDNKQDNKLFGKTQNFESVLEEEKKGDTLKTEKEFLEKKEKITPKKEKKEAFKVPTIDELEDFFFELKEEKYKEMAMDFFDYYETVGWLVGGKAKMKCWKSAARRWKRNQKQTKQKQNEPKRPIFIDPFAN